MKGTWKAAWLVDHLVELMAVMTVAQKVGKLVVQTVEYSAGSMVET